MIRLHLPLFVAVLNAFSSLVSRWLERKGKKPHGKHSSHSSYAVTKSPGPNCKWKGLSAMTLVSAFFPVQTEWHGPVSLSRGMAKQTGHVLLVLC